MCHDHWSPSPERKTTSCSGYALLTEPPNRRRQSGGCHDPAHHALDHARMWVNTGGRPVLTGEPYDLSGHEFADLLTDLSALGLTAKLDGRSPWNPGHTLLITITLAN